MKFLISRSSMFINKKPCEEAKKEMYDKIEIRALSSFEEFDTKFGDIEGKWLSKGIKHRVREEDGFIERTIPNGVKGYFLEINTLDELINFRNKYGDIIITKNYLNKDIPEIEIYDTYRE